MTLDKIYFLRHLKTKIDENLDVARWEYDDKGKQQMKEILDSNLFNNITKVYTSPQPKAKMIATEIAKKYNVPLIECPEICEVGRNKGEFIQGDFPSVVKSYFESNNFKYDWEPLSKVKERINKFKDMIKNDEGEILAVSHGQYLSLSLHNYYKQSAIDFWNELDFGKIYEIDYKKFKD